MDQMFKVIFETVRCKIMSLKFKDTLGSKELLNSWYVATQFGRGSSLELICSKTRIQIVGPLSSIFLGCVLVVICNCLRHVLSLFRWVSYLLIYFSSLLFGIYLPGYRSLYRKKNIPFKFLSYNNITNKYLYHVVGVIP